MENPSDTKLPERRKLAFGISQDAIKQIITLSSGIIALTITFANEFIGGLEPFWRVLVIIAWVLFFVSIFLGVTALGALIGTLDPAPENHDQHQQEQAEAETSDSETPDVATVNSLEIRQVARLQTIFFVLGIAIIIFVFSLSPDNRVDTKAEAIDATVEAVEVRLSVEATLTKLYENLTSVVSTQTPQPPATIAATRTFALTPSP